jgi:hypothetical protein
MARIRTIKPEFYTNEELSKLPEVTHYGMASGLLTYADDEGYFNANPGLIKAAVFPLREPSVSIHDMLTQLSSVGYLRFGSAADGKRYGHVVKFDEHQRVNRPTPSKIKDLTIQWDESVTPHGVLSESSPLERKGKERKGSGAEAPPPEFDPTSIPGLNVDAWGLWVEHRQAIKKPIRPHSLRDAAEELAKLGDRQLAEVKRARAGGWQGIHPEEPKVSKFPQPAAPRARAFPS